MSEVVRSRSRRPKTGGRRKGTPNLVTRDVREAIAALAEGNVHKLQEWLDAIAEKDPAKAADLFVRLLEYHIPKLARSEVDVIAKTVSAQVVQMTDGELLAIAMQHRQLSRAPAGRTTLALEDHRAMSK